MTKIKIINNSTSDYQHDGQEYGEWSENTTHDISGFQVVNDGEISDLEVAFELNNGTYFLLYVLYSSGDLFGHSWGNIEYVGLYKSYEDAQVNALRIKEHYHLYKGGNGNWEDAFTVKLISPSGNEFNMHVPWTGYFERIESIEIRGISKSQSMSWKF